MGWLKWLSKSKPPEDQEHQQQQGPLASKPDSRKLNQQLSHKARYPSLVPGSFYERDSEFRRKHPVQGREQGFCKIRQGGGWGSWHDAYCTVNSHQLLVYADPGGAGCTSGKPPGAGATPLHTLELVGAHLAAQRRQEVALDVPRAGHFTLLFPSEQERMEWMVGLGKVAGIFRRVSDYYTLGKTWGQGATCHVQECWGRFTGQRLALKQRVHKSREASQAMHNELRILQICARHPHPAIPHLHDFFFDEDGSIALVMDLMAGGELFDHVASRRRLRESEAREVFRRIVEGVEHLHSLGVAHRDLKPQNLMYLSPPEDGSQIKIMDYDLAKVNYAPEWRGDTPCGTVHYMAPEIVRHQKYSQAVDLWSLGVILYILLSGRMPFDGQDHDAVEAAITRGAYSLQDPVWERISADAKDLLCRLLQVDPSLRITAAECLQHPWLAATTVAGAEAGAGQQQRPGSRGAAAGTGLAPVVEEEQRVDAELPSPANLRTALSLSLRGRSRAGGVAAPTSQSLLSRLSGSPPRSPEASPRGRSPIRDLLDFDLGPLREQASLAAPIALDRVHTSSSASRLASLLPPTQEGEEGEELEQEGGSGSPSYRGSALAGAEQPAAAAPREGSTGAAGAPSGTHAAVSRLGLPPVGCGGQAATVDLLRNQLEVIGTAGGLQDRRSMAAEGRDAFPTSPTAANARRQGAGGQAPAARALGLSWADEHFADLGAEAVEEEGLHDGEEDAHSNSHASEGEAGG